MRRWTPGLTLIACALACAPTKQPPPAQPVVPRAKAPRAPAPPVHRARGDVRGGFELASSTFVSLAPIVVRFWIENIGPTSFKFDNGGDYFGHGPASYTWLVRDEHGEVECDLRGRPEPMAGGGGSSVDKLLPGGRHEQWLAPQHGCDALAKPGLHRLRAVKIMTVGKDAPPGCSTVLVPDVTVDPPDDRGKHETPECLAWLKSLPAIASELEVEILPYQREDVRAAIKRALSRPDEQYRHALSIYGSWLATRLDHPVDLAAPLYKQLDALTAALPEK